MNNLTQQEEDTMDCGIFAIYYSKNIIKQWNKDFDET